MPFMETVWNIAAVVKFGNGTSHGSKIFPAINLHWSIEMMWIKQCHTPSPSHHHFYRWYNGVYIFIYIYFIYLHIKTIPRWFLALFYPHYIGFSMGFSDLFPSGPAVPQSSRIPKTRSKATSEVLANGILPWMKRILDVETYVKHYTLWIQTLSEKVLNPPNHTPNTS